MSKQEWTDSESKRLVKMYNKGVGWLEISKVLDRTPDSCRMYYRNHIGETNKSGKLKTPEYISSNTPRVGIFDVETLPLISYNWSLWDQNIGIEQVVEPTGLLSWSGKFLNEPEMYSDILTPKEAKARDDKRISKSCWDFLDRCDVVIGHNLIDFDSKVANTFFLKHGLPPIKYVSIDTLKIARRTFRFDSNKLDYLNRRLGLRQKIENEGFRLWRECSEGDADALKRMQDYNIGDIYALEELYYILRPFVKHMNIALYSEADTEMCPVCGCEKLESNGYYYTPAGMWESVRCTDCKCVSRRKKNLLDKYKKKSLLVNS